MRKLFCILLSSTLLTNCMIPAGPRPVKLEDIDGKIGIKDGVFEAVMMPVPKGTTWQMDRPNLHLNYGNVGITIGDKREILVPYMGDLHLNFSLRFSHFQASEFGKKSYAATIQGIDPNIGTPMESYLKRNGKPYEKDFHGVVFIRRFDVGQYRCLEHVYSRVAGSSTQKPLSYTADIECPFFYQGKEAVIHYTLNVYSSEKLGEGIDAAKYRLDEILPSIELAVKSSIFSKEFTQQIPDGYLSNK